MGVFEKLKNRVQQRIVKKMILLFPRFSNKNLIRISYLAEKLVNDKGAKRGIEFVRKKFKENHPSVQLAKKIASELNPNCRNKLAKNLFIDSLLLKNDKRREYEEKESIRVPYLLVISPTMKCNLNCNGCYAAGYTKEQELDFETVDMVITEAKEMGIYFFTISGGEPYAWQHLLRIFEKHDDAYFQTYTNGTLIDEKLAKRLAELGNVAPAISVEGFEKETDKRRGKGTFKKVMRAMDILKKEGILFGFSATPTRQNSEILSSEEFFDFYIRKGCSFGWYFTYIPIGRKPSVELMQTPEQRNRLRERIKKIRQTKPIFIGDFWNDGPYVHGCIAGGRGGGYLYINCNGDVEPCVFTHFAVDNIKNKSLREALNSPFFKAIRARQPYHKNLLMPCMIIDNPKILREVVKEAGAYPTHDGAETIIKDQKIVKHLDRYSKRYHELTDSVWEKESKILNRIQKYLN